MRRGERLHRKSALPLETFEGENHADLCCYGDEGHVLPIMSVVFTTNRHQSCFQKSRKFDLLTQSGGMTKRAPPTPSHLAAETKHQIHWQVLAAFRRLKARIVAH
jgi:hypothetical protein